MFEQKILFDKRSDILRDGRVEFPDLPESQQLF